MLTLLMMMVASTIPTIDDLVFIQAQEESVMGFLPRPRLFGDGLPAPVADLIHRMGDPCLRCRDRAMGAMRGISEDDIRWVFWGMRATDPEIASRCRSILRDLPPRCETCGGIGRCPGVVVEGQRWCKVCLIGRPQHGMHQWFCVTCFGDGVSWSDGK